ncbi:MAG: hypothetical protein HOW73_31915 [Polyangiaceae bacterium]|nr:hypothetical protein [Polyangiaceae bacterium]
MNRPDCVRGATIGAVVAAIGFAAVGCLPPDPTTVLAQTPRTPVGERGVRLARDPCSKQPVLAAPVDIGAHATWLIIDTGAFRHVLSDNYARTHKLGRSGEKIRVGDGAGLDADVLSPLRLAMPGVGVVPDTTILALDAAIVGDCGTAGVLSPQRLVVDGQAVVIDLERRVLRVTTGVDALQSLDGVWLTPEVGVAPDPFEGFVVDAEIAGKTARLVVDTGSCCTTIHPDTEAGRSLEPLAREADTGLRDIQDDTASALAEGIGVTAGGVRRTVDVFLMDHRTKDQHGVLGIDFLRGCSLAFVGARMFARCHTSPATVAGNQGTPR